MHASLVRRQLGTLIPPKVATPKSLSGGSGASLTPLVEFYSKLPKGSAPTSASGGIKGRYFEGKNATAAPLAFTMLALFGLGYTIDYHKHHKNHAH
ncbi:hypothetical protein SCHPADRAFT_917890 [Schizopora paradoxa]|uniref:Uncharacterized protein n=1 Tax=Schizopora paradoxa TaxID=27342 RepID=A0A0H2R0H6_9AGAM|nr:hypothetical protein SCHPADRAFT_917890 [Schizopora paradoxa]